MRELPTGTVTFLFTDIEGSTRLLHELGDEYASVLAEHRRALRDAFTHHNGVEVDTQGDAFFVAFAKASDALAAAEEGCAALAGGQIRVRMGVHTGEPTVTAEGYVGIDVHRAARIAAVGHGGQILVSQSTRDLAGHDLRDLGEHRLKDIAVPERIYQLGDDEFPPLKSLNNSNLPLPGEPLLGRKKELADVLRLLRDSCRLVTVTGPGGTGKTRFALEAASELIESFRDGVWWVGLAPLRDEKLVLPTIATTVGVKDDLLTELRDKDLLLLLDNFEQVVDAAGGVAELQSACPGVAAIVTSREPLHIAREREYPLSPLAESPAVELFRQRAEAVAPGLDADYGQLVEVCDRLDRLPLAIELAAARTKTIPIDGLLGRLEQRLPLLTSRRRDVDDRQRTLRATIEWSYELLDDAEKEQFAALGVFVGSFDAAAAEAVCGVDFDTLESLVDKSLLHRRDDGRFFMLETIHEYACERLEEFEDQHQLQRMHAEWIKGVAISAADDLRTDRQAEVLDQLTRELPNIRAALTFAVEGADAELALAIAGSLGRFWVFRSLDAEAARWLDAALALPQDTPDVARWRSFYWRSVVAADTGDKPGAKTFVEMALDLARVLKDETLILASSVELVRRLFDEGDWEEAERLLEVVLPVARDLADPRGLAILETFRAQLLLLRGHPREALSELEAAVDVVQRVGDTQLTQSLITYLALAHVKLGDGSRARTYLRRSAVLCEELQYTWGIAVCLEIAAELALVENHVSLGGNLLLRSERIFDELGGRPSALDGALYRQTATAVRERLDKRSLSQIEAELPPADVDEARDYLLASLD